MSTKATIFLTNYGDHVYTETTDWSIVFEISVNVIEKIRYRAFNSALKEAYFDEIKLDDIRYIVIQTRPFYDFINSFKTYEFSDESFYFHMTKNTPDKLFLKMDELQSIETDKKVYLDDKMTGIWDIEVTIKKHSEWYKEYIKALKAENEGVIKRQQEIKKTLAESIK